MRSAEPPPSHEGLVLVVDDNGLNRDLLREELEDRGFSVAEAASGQEALDKARAQPPEVILMDISMPDMDGIETCKRLKADALTSQLPVVFLTAMKEDEGRTVAALNAGGNDFLQKPYSPAILVARIRSQVTIARTQEALRKQAITDELTSLFSRRFLFTSFRQQLKQASRAKATTLSVLMVDIDHFKRLNDEWGHMEGDNVLKRVAGLLRENCRESDVVARFGGEEFVILLPNTPADAAADLGEKLRSIIEQRVRSPRQVTISVGVSWYEATGTADIDPEAVIKALLRAADRALYRAKAAGRNRLVHEPL